MGDTSGERMARQVRRAFGEHNDPQLPVVQIVLDLKEKADRLAQIERQVRELADEYEFFRAIDTAKRLRAIIDGDKNE